MSVHSKMTAVADEIRELSGTTGAMGLDAMSANLKEANDDVSEQADLIAQIASALEGKAAGGSVIETCTVEVSATSTKHRFEALGYMTVDNDGNVSAETVIVNANTVTIENVVCGSMLCCIGASSSAAHSTLTAELLYTSDQHGRMYKITANAGETANINLDSGFSGGSIL